MIMFAWPDQILEDDDDDPAAECSLCGGVRQGGW